MAPGESGMMQERPRSLQTAIARLAREVPDFRVVARGSGAVLELSRSLEDTPRTSPAQLIESGPFRVIDVPAPMEAVTHFLDGIQRSRAVAYVGTVPLVEGLVGAVIRQRHERRLRSSVYAPRTVRSLYVPFNTLPAKTRLLLSELDVPVRDTSEATSAPVEEHPFRHLQLANDLVKTDRERLETELAQEFANNPSESGVLYIDGSIPLTDSSAALERVIGVIKSHNTLYVAGSALEAVLSMSEGQRSPVLRLEGRRRRHVASWYLRLRDPSHQDPFFGLVRIEVPVDALGDDIARAADERSAWALAERSPLSLPDGRWDTMAYGIRDCEKFLRAIAT